MPFNPRRGDGIPGEEDWFGQYSTPPPESPEDKLARFTRDYWAADRDQVLASMRPQGAQGGGRSDPEGFRAAWYASGGKTNEDLVRFVQQHPEFGAKVFGSKNSKVDFGNGQVFQAVRSAGIGGGIGPAWDDISGGDGGAGGGGGNWTDPYGQQFTLPTQEEFMAMPGTMAALAAGQRAVQSGAAARGTLLTGGTQKALQQNAQDIASQKYAELTGLKGQAFNTNYNVFDTDRKFRVGSLTDLARLGKPT